MRDIDRERELLQEFSEFVEAAPTAPGPAVDAAVLNRVAAALSPPRWKILLRLAMAQTAGGVLTVSVCPQFGLGFDTHQVILHGLHAALSPGFFYLACGLFFISLGAIFSGLLLRRTELRSLDRPPWCFFLGYGTLAYVVLLALGSEAFVLASLAWIVGAVAGNALGFAVTVRLRLRPV
jgi:hypothetical protein